MISAVLASAYVHQIADRCLQDEEGYSLSPLHSLVELYLYDPEVGAAARAIRDLLLQTEKSFEGETGRKIPRLFGSFEC